MPVPRSVEYREAKPIMSLTVLFGSAIVTVLLLLSPLSFSAKSDCSGWTPPAKAVAAEPAVPCPGPPMMMPM